MKQIKLYIAHLLDRWYRRDQTCAMTSQQDNGMRTMSDSHHAIHGEQTQARRHAVELLYRAFSDKNPDLMDLAVTADCDDIPPAPGQGRGPDGLKPVIRSVIDELAVLTSTTTSPGFAL